MYKMSPITTESLLDIEFFFTNLSNNNTFKSMILTEI